MIDRARYHTSLAALDALEGLSDAELDDALFKANEAGQKLKLVAIYAAAASRAEDVDVQAFLTTQAYVFALETNHPLASTLHAKLVALGRELPQDPL